MFFPLKNNKGVAILMIMTSIALLSFILAEFTYDTKLNKIKIYNIQDKFQARLNAESGLRFALSKLKIYKETRNIYEKNTNGVQSYISADKLESMLTEPLFFPIEEALLSKANIIQRKAIEEFTKSIILKGKLQVTITPVSGLLNVNNLRAPPPKKDNNTDKQDTNNNVDPNTGASDPDDKNKKSTDHFIEDELKKILDERILEKREKDEVFDLLYGNIDTNLLVKELKYYVNSPSKFNDSEKGELENLYSAQNIRAKHAPMASLSEMYLLVGWKEGILDLIKDELTVHAASIIPLNKINGPQLKLIFPNITTEQIKEFMIHRDGGKGDDKELSSLPHKLKTLEDFKSLIVDKLQVIDGGAFDTRIKEFKEAGIVFGGASKLFKVVSVGEYGRSTVTVVAYIDLPIKPESKKKTTNNNNGNNPDQSGQDNGSSEVQTGETSGNDPNKKDKEKSILQFFPPRIIEMQLN